MVNPRRGPSGTFYRDNPCNEASITCQSFDIGPSLEAALWQLVPYLSAILGVGSVIFSQNSPLNHLLSLFLFGIVLHLEQVLLKGAFCWDAKSICWVTLDNTADKGGWQLITRGNVVHRVTAFNSSLISERLMILNLIVEEKPKCILLCPEMFKTSREWRQFSSILRFMRRSRSHDSAV